MLVPYCGSLHAPVRCSLLSIAGASQGPSPNFCENIIFSGERHVQA